MYTNNIVKYQVKDNKVEESTDSKVVYGDTVTKEVEENVAKLYPFSKGVPNWAISLLKECNNIDETERVI